jgi:hypothetical protein
LDFARMMSGLRAADLLPSANLEGCFYDDDTRWPEGFDPEAAGARHVDEDEEPGSVPPPA